MLVFWVLVGAASYVFGVRSSTGQRVEESVLAASSFNTNPPAPLSLVSPMSIAVALIALGLIALWVHGIYRTLVVTLVPAAAIIASQLLKSEVLARPDFLTLEAENTFPSGHMTVFTVIVAGAVFAVPRSVRALVACGGAALLGVVSWQLMTYGWHRPSDVFGALALGTACFAAATLLAPLKPSSGVWLVRTASLALVLAGWIAIAVALVFLVLSISRGNDDLMLSAGQWSAIGLGLLSSHSLLRLSMLARSAKGSGSAR